MNRRVISLISFKLQFPTSDMSNHKPMKFTIYLQTKSGKELVGFLFNDFLLLTQPQRSLGDVASVFSFDIKANTQFKMYRTVR